MIKKIEQSGKFLKRYYKKDTIEDPRYGKLVIYADSKQPGHFIAEKSKWVNTKESFLYLKNLVDIRSKLTIKSKGSILYNYDEKVDDVCASFYKFKIYHEWFQKTLFDHIL